MHEENKDVQNVSHRKDCKPHYNTKLPKSTRERNVSEYMLNTSFATFQPLSLKQRTPALSTWINSCPHLS
jgi:hypothetical protein